MEGFTYIILEGDYLRLVFDALKLRNFQKNMSETTAAITVRGYVLMVHQRIDVP